MALFCISDLHLSLNAPDKGMEVFGTHWKEHMTRMARNWERAVGPQDIVLVPGDISWSASLSQASPDLRWLDQLPGTKILVKGNHDHWWDAIGKARAAMPRSVRLLQNDSLRLGTTLFFGARLGDTDEIDNLELIAWDTPDGLPPEKYRTLEQDHPDRIAQEAQYLRELERLKLSISSLPSGTEKLRKIALVHYPPTAADLHDTRATALLESVPGLTDVVFGHLHSVRRDLPTEPFGVRRIATAADREVRYHLCSADWLEFAPKRLPER
jgi:predicted phosphohydrolase